MAYNEAANIGNTMGTILGHQLTVGDIAELIVVASGCTDGTPDIVASIARRDARVRLIVQERREGKASAINQFLAAARAPVLVLVGADVLIKAGSLDALLGHFRDPAVGMVGGHPIPVNGEVTFLGHAVHLLWELHDRVARDVPKLGEIVAFRNVLSSIPHDTPVDELAIQALITQLGYRLAYEPRAIVYNRGPTTVGDFLRQRRRIYAGHLHAREQLGYMAPTMSTMRIAQALLEVHPYATLRDAWWTLGMVGMEALARGQGMYDYLRRRPQHIWEMAATTKSHIVDEANGRGRQSVLVFQIAGFYQHTLELGARASQMLVQQVVGRMRQVLGSSIPLSTEHNGIVIALLPMDRDDAERRAQQLIDTIERTPLRVNGHPEEVTVKLACGITTFLQAGQAVALSIA